MQLRLASRWSIRGGVFAHRIELVDHRGVVLLPEHTQLIRIVALWHQRQPGWRRRRGTTRTIRGRRGSKFGTFIRRRVFHVKPCQIRRIAFEFRGATWRSTRLTNLHRQGAVLRWIFARFHESFHVVFQRFLLAVFQWTIRRRLGWILHVTVVLEAIFRWTVLYVALVGRFHRQVLRIILVLRRSVTLSGCSGVPH